MSSNRFSSLVLLLSLGTCVALAAVSFAAEDAIKVSAKPAAPATAGIVRATPGAVIARPLSTEEKALLAVQDEAARNVEDLGKAMQGLPDGPALRALQGKVEEVKKAANVKFLQIKIQFAHQRGDLAAAHQAEQVLDSILNPKPPTPARVDRPTPDKSVGN